MLNSPQSGTKPNTLKRFDSVFTAIGLMINLAGWSFAQTLVSLVQLLYHRITNLSFQDPVQLANVLKWNRAYYLAFIRGGRSLADLMIKADNTNPLDSYSGTQDREARIMFRIMNYRSELLELGTTPRDLLYYDRLVFAILSFDRIMTFSTDPNFSTITDSSEFVYDPEKGFFDDLAGSLERLGITPSDFWKEYRNRTRSLRHVIMSTSGPNGPASWTAATDAKAILGNTNLYMSFKFLAEQSGLQWLLLDMLSTVSVPSFDSTNDSMIHSGRLHSFEEWGGKVRIVAIVDYWTQILLSPLHDTIFHFLSRIPSDGTFNQDAAVERVRLFTANKDLHVYSYDLTAATDRLPLTVQVEILGFLTNKNFAKEWANLLVGRPYHYRPDNKDFTYAVGQPMGARSSWAMLALTHHVIVQQAAKTASSESYTEYALLGDDITLTGTPIASAYLGIMRALKVSINMTKSVVHYAGATAAAEFAKRVFVGGSEITTIPVKLLAKTIMNGRLAPQLQNELIKRHLDTTASWPLAWLTGLIDLESGKFLSILNVLPTSLSSLLSAISPGGKLADFSKWYGDKKALTEADLKNAFLYTAITEQLKRLDNLLRQAQVIHAAIEQNAFGYSTLDPARILGWNYTNPDHDIKKIGASMPRLTPSHPIIKAAQSEMDRISALLADLRSGDSRVTSAAQNRLLDMFRSSLVDAWADPEAARGQADRSLLQRSLMVLSDVILNKTEKSSGRPAHTVDFTVNLAYINRLWTVVWTLGSAVQINSVKSRVLSLAVDANARLTTLSNETDVVKMFHVPIIRKESKGSKSLSNTPISKMTTQTVLGTSEPISSLN